MIRCLEQNCGFKNDKSFVCGIALAEIICTFVFKFEI